MTEQKGKYLINLYRKPLMYSVLLGFIILLISLIIIFIAIKTYKKQELDNVKVQLELIKSKVNRIVKSTDLEAFNLALQLSHSGKFHSGTLPNLDSIGKLILSRNNFISGIEVVEGSVIKTVYPYEQHKAAIGLDIMKASHARVDALKAIKSKKIFYAGPLELKQGGKAIIARLPLFHNGEFWGFTAILIDFNLFLEEAGMNSTIDENIHMKFSYFNEHNGEYEVWNAYQGSYSQMLEYQFEDSNWKVSIYSETVFETYIILFLLIISGVLLSIFGAYILFSILKKPVILEKLLQDKSKELLKQNNYFSSLINAIPDFIFIVDLEGEILNFHSSSRDGLIDKPENFIGRNLSSYLDKDLCQRLIGKINFTAKHGELTSHTYSINDKGDKEYFEARIVKINQKEVLIFVRKITTMVKTNTKLLLSENKYRQLVEQAPDFIFQTDKEGNFTSINKAGLKITAYKQSELMNKSIDQLLKLPNKEESIFNLLKKKKLEPINAILIDKHGMSYAIEIIVSINNDGGLLGISRDVTERNKYIEFIENQNKNLSEIAWIQSHQVRAPLTNIMTLVEFMKSNYDQGDFNRNQLIIGMEKSLHELDKIVRDVVAKSEDTMFDFWENKNEED